MSKINYLGKRKNGTVEAVANRLKVSVADVNDMKDNPIRYIHNTDTGDIDKIDIRNSPLLLREFGVKKINNRLITGGAIKKGIYITKEPIPLNIEVTGKIMGVIQVVWVSSGNGYETTITIDVEKEVLTSIDDVIRRLFNKMLDSHPIVENDVSAGLANMEIAKKRDGGELGISFITRNETELTFDRMVLKGKPLNICRIYGENVELNESNNDSCVLQVITKMYKRISPNTIKKYISKDGATTQDMLKFCMEYDITMKIFDIAGNIIERYNPTHKSNNHKTPLIGIAYNNHFYPIKNSYLRKVPKIEPTELVLCSKLQDKLIELLKTGEYPNNDSVGIHNDVICNFQIGSTVYHNNKDYESCLEILTALGLEKSMTYFINKQNIHKVIEPLFLKSSVDSFFPHSSNEGGYNHVNKEFDETKKTISLDHNKHYSDALRKLKYLIKIDIKTAKHIMNPTKLEEGYFYIASPKYSSILLPKTNFASCDYLQFCKKEGVEFELLEAISCEYKENYYTDMINTLYQKLSNENFKFVVNCMIGSFEKKSATKSEMKFVKIANQDETKASEGYVKKLDDEYNMIYEVDETPTTDIFNKVPIRIQTLCEARKIIYKKIKELKLTPDKIKQIRCDSITFTYTKKITEGKEIGEWKMQDSKPLRSDLGDANDDEPPTFKLDAINSSNKLFADYAGSGKTHYIINELIPKLDDYIVLSPSHASIREYRSKKINCNVIQKYCFSHTVPTEKNIIVDEVGMLDSNSNNILVKSAMMGKNIYSFGDFKQLKPVSSEPCDSPIYLNYMYGHITKLGTNYRNDFTFEYYDSLIGMTKSKDILAEVNKHNSKSYEEAETIITYTNSTRQKYNKKMITKLGIDYAIVKGEKHDSYKIKTPSVGCKIVCHTNELRDKDIYNNFYYTIKSVDDEITITDGVDDIVISEKQLKTFFDFGYCRTLYNIQGESLSSFYFTLEDMNHIDGRALYTLISRLKK
jgi:hypothetical protein